MQIVWEKSRLEIEKGFQGRVNIRKGLAGSSDLSKSWQHKKGGRLTLCLDVLIDLTQCVVLLKFSTSFTASVFYTVFNIPVLQSQRLGASIVNFRSVARIIYRPQHKHERGRL